MTDREAEALEAEVVREDDDSAASNATNTIVSAADILPGTLYLLPLSERPFFPAQALPLLLNEEPWLPTIEAAANREQRVIGLILGLARVHRNNTSTAIVAHMVNNLPGAIGILFLL